MLASWSAGAQASGRAHRCPNSWLAGELTAAMADYFTSLQVDAMGTAAGTEGLFTAVYDKLVKRRGILQLRPWCWVLIASPYGPKNPSTTWPSGASRMMTWRPTCWIRLRPDRRAAGRRRDSDGGEDGQGWQQRFETIWPSMVIASTTWTFPSRCRSMTRCRY